MPNAELDLRVLAGKSAKAILVLLLTEALVRKAACKLLGRTASGPLEGLLLAMIPIDPLLDHGCGRGQ